MLIVNQQEMNLGNLKLSVPFSFKYKLGNDSDKPLKIKKMILGCDRCTKATASKSVLNPGENIDLDVIFTPGSKGLALKTITIESDQNTLELKFRAKIDG